MPLPVKNITWPPLELAHVAHTMERWSAWYSGDVAQLEEAYQRDHRVNRPSNRPSTYRGGVVGAVARSFWGSPRHDLTQPKPKSHVPLAGDICQASADLLFSEPPTFTVEDTKTQDQLHEMVNDGMLSTLAETAELTAALGGGYLRVTWDQAIEPAGPFTTAIDADGAWPEFRWGRLQAVTFWTDVTPAADHANDRRLRHLERHELALDGNGIILHGLYEGTRTNLGRQVPLTEVTTTQALADVVQDGNMIDTLSPGLAVTYVPNQRPVRSWRHDLVGRNLGRSDLDGVEGLMDSLDETYTSWMRDIRLGKARVFVAQSLLENLPAGHGAAWDSDQEVFSPLNALGAMKDGNSLIQAEQFEIRFAEHDATAKAIIQNILRTAGYSTQTFGMDSDTRGNVTATEIEARQSRSYMTRDRKTRHWKPALADHIEKLLAVHKAIFNSDVTPARPTVEFPDGVQESPATLAATAAALYTAEAASTKTLVEMVHPDWTEKQVDDEVTLIRAEKAAAAPQVGDPFSTGLPPQ